MRHLKGLQRIHASAWQGYDWVPRQVSRTAVPQSGHLLFGLRSILRMRMWMTMMIMRRGNIWRSRRRSWRWGLLASSRSSGSCLMRRMIWAGRWPSGMLKRSITVLISLSRRRSTALCSIFIVQAAKECTYQATMQAHGGASLPVVDQNPNHILFFRAFDYDYLNCQKQIHSRLMNYWFWSLRHGAIVNDLLLYPWKTKI
jgi:hypothetical protein